MKIGVNRKGKYQEVFPKDLTTKELCDLLADISVDTTYYWMPEIEGSEGSAAIKEAIRRLKKAD